MFAIPLKTQMDDAPAPAVITPAIGTVEPATNHIYFYEDVCQASCLGIIRQLDQMDNQLAAEARLRQQKDATPIWLHIQSLGGEVFAAYGLIDQIQRLQRPVYSIVEGVAASAATIISCSCVRRYITVTSYMLIHSVSWGLWGQYEDWKDAKNLMDMQMESLTDFYITHTTMKRKKVRKLLKHDSWFNATQCLELGLIDEVLK